MMLYVATIAIVISSCAHIILIKLKVLCTLVAAIQNVDNKINKLYSVCKAMTITIVYRALCIS